MATSTKKQRICLVAVDGSKHADWALKWYSDNVHKAGDKVLLAHCVDHRTNLTVGNVAVVPGSTDAITKAFAAEEVKAKELVDRYLKECKKLGLEAEPLKIVGDAGEGIVQASKDQNAELIVTGCRGLGQIRRTMLGSVSDYIMHHSEVPVFICRH